MGDGDVSGTARSSSLSVVVFLSSCFRTVLRYEHLHIQSECWRSSMETEDMMMQERLEKSSCEFEELDLICFAACGM